MKKTLLIFLLICYGQLFAQSNIKNLEKLVSKTVEEFSVDISKNNFKILNSNYVQSTTDTSLYGMQAKWINNRNEFIILDRMMDYIPLINKSNTIQVGKVKVLKKSVSLIIGGQQQAENILNSLKLSKYKKNETNLIGKGFEVKYENQDYNLTYKKISTDKEHQIIYYFIVEEKAYQIVKKILFDTDNKLP